MKYLMRDRDELADKEATAAHVNDRKRLVGKETEFSTKRGKLNKQERLTPGDSNIRESFTTEHEYSSTLCLDGARTIVEELTVGNYSSGKMEMGNSGVKEKIHSPHDIWQDLFTERMHSSNERKNEIQNDAINLSPSAIRTKMASQSGFSQYLKNTMKGKGAICSGPSLAHDAPVHMRGQNHLTGAFMDINYAPDVTKEVMGRASSVHKALSLRDWLKSGRNKSDKSKSMYIFKQILDLVDTSHSRGEALLALRPSCFKLMPQNQVLYVGSPKTWSNEFGTSENNVDKKRELEPNLLIGASLNLKRRKHGDKGNFSRWPQFAINSGHRDSGYGFHDESMSKRDHSYAIQSMTNSPHLSPTSQIVSNVGEDALEEQWYASPEDSNERCSTLSSNVYSLGVLLFELLGSFESARAHAIAMANLRQRILPPSYLLENPKEVGFCLWLLHPEPSLRPTTRDIQQSELIRGIQIQQSQFSLTSAHEDTESDLMLHFFASLKEQKRKDGTKLVEDIKCLESDILEIESRRPNNTLTSPEPGQNVSNQENRPTLRGKLKSSTFSSPSGSRLINNIDHLEQVYFSVRSTIGNPDPIDREHEVLRSRENNIATKNMEADKKPLDRLGVFFNGLCKYARYSKFEVRGILRNSDFGGTGNVICSLGFDRDEDYFATAGVSKKIKVYDFHSLLNDSDIHYPAVEMSNKSKLSSICWNGYIRNYLASTDYDGVVKIWDAGTGETVSNHIEHEKRAWSVDFSRVDPIKFASGSDDCSVKLWSINEKKSLATIKTAANVCCVQYSPYSTHLLSFGSADYRTYCYDLRNVSTPLCTLSGHDRAVSYVKFLDSGTLVSASTDNTLKLWDLNKADFGCLSTSSCILTFKGHANEKNFVGLSVADGYIACGSETNEVFAYHRSLPMPITTHKFGSIDPISGKETPNESSHFVSSVCWRQKSDMVVAANSTGCLKVLQMV